MSVSTSSCVASIDEALVMEANKFPRSFSLSSLGPMDPASQPISMLLRNDSLLEYSKNAEKDPWGKEEEAMVEKVEPPKALAIACVPGRVGVRRRRLWSRRWSPLRPWQLLGSWRGLDSLPTNFVNFNNFLRLPVEGFEKEISSLLKKLKSRKGCGGQGFKWKKEYSIVSSGKFVN